MYLYQAQCSQWHMCIHCPNGLPVLHETSCAQSAYCIFHAYSADAACRLDNLKAMSTGAVSCGAVLTSNHTNTSRHHLNEHTNGVPSKQHRNQAGPCLAAAGKGHKSVLCFKLLSPKLASYDTNVLCVTRSARSHMSFHACARQQQFWSLQAIDAKAQSLQLALQVAGGMPQLNPSAW